MSQQYCKKIYISKIKTHTTIKKGENIKMKKVIPHIIKIIWVFLLGCIFGYVVEMITSLFQVGHFESRQGLIYGPFAQVYGIGMVVYYLILPKIQKNTIIFIASMLIGASVEYICSYFQEKYFGTVSWDYHNLFLNINGRTALLYGICWGFAGIIFKKQVLPIINKIDKYCTKVSFQYFTLFISILMAFNIIISCMAGLRQKERMQMIKAEGFIDVFLDKQYPDYKMNKIYANKIQKEKIK